MSYQAPPTLQQLAFESLLKKEALTISGLAGLPWFLFPAAFERAFRNNQTDILRAMVPAWPFTCLPVGILMKTPHLETLKALLDGLDVLITEEPCPRRGKIRVLDLTNRDTCVNRSQSCEREFFLQFTREKTVETFPYSRGKKYLHVINDLSIMDSRCGECTTYLWRWAQQRQNSVHLCCPKSHILTSKLFPTAIDFLKSVDLHCVRELKHLYINDAPALVGSLADCLRCLKKPLQTLSITHCYIIQRDLDYLPLRLNLSSLKHLYLSFTMLDRCIQPLGYLLESVKDTLETLDLAGCRLEDSQFSALMPALSQCSQLLEINFYMNELSLPILKQLLHLTAKLNKLTKEIYPVPPEYYDGCRVLVRRFDELGPELLDILRSERQLKEVCFFAVACSIEL
ncbi:oogenesin-1-like [Alexandromys fortis]|uniref:oogenesin-1-like n=1 Tax=Alexandromys fortis TaxID=100897 RepID=UPI0021523A25|nr:oogenesin-1-like [Microtus fortis]